MGSFEIVQKFVTDMRKALVRLALAEGLCVLATGVLLLLAGAMLLANHIEQPHLLRAAVWVSLLVVAATAAVAIGQPLVWTRSTRKIALYVESRLPNLHSAIVSTVEFGGLTGSKPDLVGLSMPLVQQTAQTAANHLRDLAPDKLTDKARLDSLKRLVLAVSVTTMLAVFWSPETFRAGAVALMSDPISTTVEDTTTGQIVDVAVRDIRIRYEFPAYMGLPARDVLGAAGDLTAYPGTEIRIEGKTITPVKTGELVFFAAANAETPVRVPLTVGSESTVSGRFIATVSGTYSFEFTTPDGEHLSERARRAVDLEPDLAPELVLLIPQADLEVNLNDSVPVVFRATDDFGLGTIELVHQVRNKGEPVRQRVQTLEAEKQFQGDTQLELASLDLKPGDTVDVWVEAQDLNTVSGPTRGQSEVRSIKIWSPAEKHEEIVDSLAQIVELMLTLLADRSEGLLAEGRFEHYPAILDSVGVYNAQSQVLVKALDAVLEAVTLDPLMPEDVHGQIMVIRTRHDEIQRAEAHTLTKAIQVAQMDTRKTERISLFSGHNNDVIGALEKDIIALEKLVDKLREQKLMEQTRDLLSQQNELMDLLAAMKDGASAEDQERAQKQVDQLQQQLENMMQQVAKSAKNLPYENFNAGALDPEGTQKNVMDFQKMLDEIRKKIQEGDMEGAMKLAEEMQKQMAEMMAQMEQGFEGMPMAGGGGPSPMMQEMQGDLANLEREQAKLVEETDPVAEAQRKAMEEKRKEQLDAILEEQKQKAQALREELDQINPKNVSESSRNKLADLKNNAAELKDTLEQKEVAQAQKTAEKLAQDAAKLKDEMKAEAEKQKSKQQKKSIEKSSGQCENAGNTASDIAKALDELTADPSDPNNAEHQKKLKELAERQRGTKEKLKEFGQKMAENSEGMPGLKEMFDEMLEGAEQSMEQAQSKLEQGKGQQASLHEEDALDQLGQAKKRMQQMMQSRPGQSGVGAGLSNENTEIPKAEDYAPPAAFREAVLRAEKQPSPKKYEELNKEYYKSLFR